MKSFLVAIIFALVAGLGVLALNKAPVTKNAITCQICKDLVQQVDDALLANQTISEIESILDAFCDLLPAFEDNCKQFVADQLPIIINLLVDEYLNPEEVCFNIYACP